MFDRKCQKNVYFCDFKRRSLRSDTVSFLMVLADVNATGSLVYAANVKSRRHFLDKDIGGLITGLIVKSQRW